MKIGTSIKIILIVDDRFTNRNLKSELSLKRIRLKRKLKNTGLQIQMIFEERNVVFKCEEKSSQIRQEFYLETTKEFTKNDIYRIINGIEAQPLKFF